MELLLEVLFEIIFEGSFELGASRQVPRLVRLIAILVFAVISIGIAVILFLVAVVSFRGGSRLLGGVLLVMLAFWLLYLLRAVRRFLR